MSETEFVGILRLKADVSDVQKKISQLGKNAQEKPEQVNKSAKTFADTFNKSLLDNLKNKLGSVFNRFGPLGQAFGAALRKSTLLAPLAQGAGYSFTKETLSTFTAIKGANKLSFGDLFKRSIKIVNKETMDVFKKAIDKLRFEFRGLGSRTRDWRGLNDLIRNAPEGFLGLGALKNRRRKAFLKIRNAAFGNAGNVFTGLSGAFDSMGKEAGDPPKKGDPKAGLKQLKPIRAVFYNALSQMFNSIGKSKIGANLGKKLFQFPMVGLPRLLGLLTNPITLVVAGLIAAGFVIAKFITGIIKATKAQLKYAQTLTVSGKMAAVMAIYNVQSMLLNMQRGNAQAGSAKFLAKSDIYRQKQLLGIGNLLENTKNTVLGGLNYAIGGVFTGLKWTNPLFLQYKAASWLIGKMGIGGGTSIHSGSTLQSSQHHMVTLNKSVQSLIKAIDENTKKTKDMDPSVKNLGNILPDFGKMVIDQYAQKGSHNPRTSHGHRGGANIPGSAPLNVDRLENLRYIAQNAG